MVEKQDGEIVLDNGVHVLPVFDHYCNKCKKNLKKDQSCHKCIDLSYELVLNLGYYIPSWYNNTDAYLDKNIKNRRTCDLNKVNPKYRFGRLINDAKSRYEDNTISEKKRIIKILCAGYVWKIKKYESEFLKIIDLIIHVPKKEENPHKDEDDMTLFNHGYYYASFISKGLRIPFDNTVIIEEESSRKGNRLFSINNARRIQNRKVMIVDDVYTNAYTKGRISDLLIKNSALEVYIGVIARTVA